MQTSTTTRACVCDFYFSCFSACRRISWLAAGQLPPQHEPLRCLLGRPQPGLKSCHVLAGECVPKPPQRVEQGVCVAVAAAPAGTQQDRRGGPAHHPAAGAAVREGAPNPGHQGDHAAGRGRRGRLSHPRRAPRGARLVPRLGQPGPGLPRPGQCRPDSAGLGRRQPGGPGVSHPGRRRVPGPRGGRTPTGQPRATSRRPPQEAPRRGTAGQGAASQRLRGRAAGQAPVAVHPGPAEEPQPQVHHSLGGRGGRRLLFRGRLEGGRALGTGEGPRERHGLREDDQNHECDAKTSEFDETC
ncbi:hypothetical protein FOCC_FOCC002308 [Frankliniella occidentalis]|nr:hypothetical protein FOCC_FOCC002308 [Frankliniella occidentalis]